MVMLTFPAQDIMALNAFIGGHFLGFVLILIRLILWVLFIIFISGGLNTRLCFQSTGGLKTQFQKQKVIPNPQILRNKKSKLGRKKDKLKMLSRVNPSLPLVVSCCSRCISTTVIKYADKNESIRKFKKWDSRKPWDKRFPVNPKDVGPTKEGGSKEMLNILPERLVAPTGIVDKQTNDFIHIPEMVPEFVVPDLTDFPLKPYVTYTAKDIKQNELTPKDIFNSVYAANVEESVRSGKIKVQDGKVHLEDGEILDLETGQRIT